MAKCRCDYCIGDIDRRQEIKHGGVLEEELPRGPKKKKNTKKWCKGKVGVKHVWEVDFPYTRTDRVLAEICVNCGKHGKFIYEGWSF